MKLTKNNVYKSKLAFESLDAFKATLFYYYQPIVGPISISLFNTLYLESQNSYSNSLFIPIERLTSVLKINMDELNKSINSLVKVGLLDILQSEKEKNKVILVLQKPKTSSSFENTKELYIELEQNIDKRNLMISKKYIQENVSKENDGFVSVVNKSEILACKVKGTDSTNYIKCKMHREVTSREQDMITLLIDKYKLSSEVVNGLILYSIVKNKAVVTAYIVKIAESLIEKSVNTYDKLIKYLSKIDLSKNEITKKEENPFIERVLSEEEKVKF